MHPILLLQHLAAACGTSPTLSLCPLPHAAAGTDLLTKVLDIVFATTGAISLLVITIAGFRYIVSRGDPQKVGQAKDAILYAIIGLVVTISGLTIVTFVLSNT